MTRRKQPRRWGATLACLAAFAVTVAYAPALATGGASNAERDVAASVEKRDAESLERPIGPDQSKSPKPEEDAAGEDAGEQSQPPAEPDQSKAPGPDQSKAPGSSGRPIGPQGKPAGYAKPDPPGHGGTPPGQGEPPKSDGDPDQGKNPTVNEPKPQPEPGGEDKPGQGKAPLDYQPQPEPGDDQGKGPTGNQGKAPTAERPQSEEPPTRAERREEISSGSRVSESAADPSASTEARGAAETTSAQGAGPSDGASGPSDSRVAQTGSSDAAASGSEGAAALAAPTVESGAPVTEADGSRGDQPSSRGREPGTDSAPAPERGSGGVMFVSGVPSEVLLGLVAFALTAAGLAIGLLREHRRYREVEQDALTDPVTGLANRIAFEHQLALDWQRSLRYGRPLGLIMIDLDDFKRTNDTRGHVAGDRVLRETAETVAREIRGGDVAARIGGDEFVVLAAEADGDGLEMLSRRLRRALDERGIAASVGCGERTPDDGAASQVLDRADQSMYDDKERRKSGDYGAVGARG